MKTLKEVLNEAGISFAHVARMNNISTQAVNQYRDYQAVIEFGHIAADIDVFKNIEDEYIYNENGRIMDAKYKLVRSFYL